MNKFDELYESIINEPINESLLLTYLSMASISAVWFALMAIDPHKYLRQITLDLDQIRDKNFDGKNPSEDEIKSILSKAIDDEYQTAWSNAEAAVLKKHSGQLKKLQTASGPEESSKAADLQSAILSMKDEFQEISKETKADVLTGAIKSFKNGADLYDFSESMGYIKYLKSLSRKVKDKTKSIFNK